MEKTGPSLTSRALAVLVLLIGAWVLLKFVIGLVTAVASFVVIALAVVAVVWALRVLL
jgi:hypothetical protein